MADKNLHDLPDISALADTDYVILTSGGIGRKISVGELKKQLSGGSGGDYNALENQPVKWLNSEEGNPVIVRTLNSGLYIFSGTFLPYSGAEETMSFSAKCLVQVLNTGTITHLLIFYPPNATFQYCRITNEVYERYDYKLGRFQKDTIDDIENHFSASNIEDVFQEIGKRLEEGTLPEVTSADDGKVLKVVGGKWTAVSE